ncbi:MAG: cobalt transporter CbiM [Deltaproteobacteria bacterium]|nr:cobalt transporter CbiM [Deltaproteobacteria bacterium]
MHISEGILSPKILLAGAVLSAGGVVLGLKKLKNEDIPKAAVLSSAFFVASLIHVPLGPASCHLVLNGLNGILLGWTAFPCILLSLALQAVLFQFGGLTTIGVNSFSMAMPAVISYYLFRTLTHKGKKLAFLAGFLAGSLALLMAALFVGLALVETEKSFSPMVGAFILMNFPISLVEGVISGFVILYLKKVKPEMLT